jgi:hypothetical protein
VGSFKKSSIMKEENKLSVASLKDCRKIKISKKSLYSLCFLKDGIVQIIISKDSLLFSILKNEEKIAKKFHQKPKSYIMAN